MTRLLIVDDELSILEFFQIFLKQEGYHVDIAQDQKTTLQFLDTHTYDLVITDLSMPEMDGLFVLKKVREISPDTITIIMTAYATPESAVEAMRSGAYDYLMKPFKIEEVRRTIRNAVENSRLRKENQNLRKELAKGEIGLKRFIGASEKIEHIRDLIRRVADNKTSVLLFGESGTGKELAARAIHELSSRSNHPFVSINCGAIPENLLESELFGHQKGAFTGADSHKMGLFEAAQGGTLFLDEISELALHMQVKLLRVLQEKTIRRLGSTQDTPIDVRVVSATNKDLEKQSSAGVFREDLFYRLNVIQIKMPPLRERRDDIPILINAFLKKTCAEQGKDIKGLSPEVIQYLMNYDYPGNVRELENLIEQAVALAVDVMIFPNSLPDKIVRAVEKNVQSTPSAIPSTGVDLEASLDQYEKNLLIHALRLSDGVRKKAADLLHISFRSMRYRLTKHHINIEDEAV